LQIKSLKATLVFLSRIRCQAFA